MAFGIPGSDTGSGGGEFLGRINCDARTGFWTITRRIQDQDGMWTNSQSEPFQNPTFLVDFGSLEIGYMKITSPPSFLMVPYGHPVPPQPQEMADAMRPGEKPRRAFAPGFRLKVMSKATFGDADAYYLSGSSKTLMNAVDALHQVFLAAPEAAKGLVPVVKVDGSDRIAAKTQQGTNTFYAPRFKIASWAERPAALGDRTVPPPAAGAAPAPAPKPAANHVPPPAPKAAPKAATAPAPAADDADDLPF